MRPARIYIAGPMRGYPEHNFPAFNQSAARFRSLGWFVENPVDIGAALANNNPEVPGGEYLRADVRVICECSAIALLPAWERSTGARAEVALGISIGLTFYDAETCLRREAPTRVTICGGYECAPGSVDTLDALREDILAWQAATFPQATPHSIATHLLKEANELHERPTADEELADVLFLAIGLSRDRDVCGILRAKLEVNQARTWGTPDADGVVEHIAEGVA
ncbi:hypothetical protein BH11GEM2_BH11GEM2_40440 [soil metagenome]|jgi:hypothetical protein